MTFPRVGRCATSLVLITLITRMPLVAQDVRTDLQQRLARADSLFLNGALSPATTEYRTVVQRDSTNDVAWYRLGLALERLGNYDDAIAAYARATRSATLQVMAELGMTRILAQQPGKADAAMEHLRLVARAGIDPAVLDAAPALASLRVLPAYAEVRKTAEEVRFPCRNVHTFDFWAGDFDASQWYNTSGTSGGQLHNTREYDGCVFVEHWMPRPGNGPPGTSFAFYDATRKAWRFIWNDDNNGSIEFQGDYRDGAMRLEGSFVNSDGSTWLARNVLENVSPDTIRHAFSVSKDGGKTWTIQADDRFVRRHPATPGAAGQMSQAAQQVRAAGDSAIARRDWKALVSIYEPVTREQPENGMAWFRLGAGLQELGKLAPAANALRHAVALQFQPAQSEYRLANVLARMRMLDSAQVHLERALAAGLAVEIITSDSAFASLRARRRVATLIDSLESIRYPCRGSPEAHQFDFWIGDWIVTPWNGASVSIGRRAENHIQPELAHCVVHERWTSATGGRGESINFWDPNRRVWRQVWMDEGQWSLDYEGEFKDGAMRFHGWSLGPSGERRLERLTFFAVAKDTVRQLFEQSTDSGRTWRATFDGRYVRMTSNKR